MLVTIDASEVHDLASDLRSAGPYVEERAPLAVSKTCHDIEATAHVLVPVDTGFLDSTIGTEVNGMSGDVFATAEYSDFVERGTSEMSPQPYLGPAFDQHEPTLETALGSLGEQAVRGV